MSNILTESMKLSTINFGSNAKKGVIPMYFFVEDHPFVIEDREIDKFNHHIVVGTAKPSGNSKLEQVKDVRIFTYDFIISTLYYLIDKTIGNSGSIRKSVSLIFDFGSNIDLDKSYYKLSNMLSPNYKAFMVHGNKNYGLYIYCGGQYDESIEELFNKAKKEIDSINTNISPITLNEYPRSGNIASYNTDSLKYALHANEIINQIPPRSYLEKIGLIGGKPDYEVIEEKIKISDSFFPYNSETINLNDMAIRIDTIGSNLSEKFKELYLNRFYELYTKYYSKLDTELSIGDIEGIVNDFTLYVESFKPDDYLDLDNYLFIKLCNILNIFVRKTLLNCGENNSFNIGDTTKKILYSELDNLNNYLKGKATGSDEYKDIINYIDGDISNSMMRRNVEPYPYLYRIEYTEYEDYMRFRNNGKYINLDYFKTQNIDSLNGSDQIRKKSHPFKNSNELQFPIGIDDNGDQKYPIVTNVLILDPYLTKNLRLNDSTYILERFNEFNFVELGGNYDNVRYSLLTLNPLFNDKVPNKPTDIIEKNRYLSKFVSFARYLNALIEIGK